MSIEEIRAMSMSELDKEIQRRRNELYQMCQERSRHIGDVPESNRNIDFEKYVTK